jgi:hypothetical protein
MLVIDIDWHHARVPGAHTPLVFLAYVVVWGTRYSGG